MRPAGRLIRESAPSAVISNWCVTIERDAHFGGSVWRNRYTRSMDSTLAELAVSGAQAIVKLMATDAWEGAKKLVARIFSSRPESVQQEIVQDLDSSRLKLTAEGSHDTAVEQYELIRWETLLRQLLLEDPSVASLVADMLEFARSEGVPSVGDSTNIVINAHAQDSARIYQQGSGVQHNS